jgi:hypothetical protein
MFHSHIDNATIVNVTYKAPRNTKHVKKININVSRSWRTHGKKLRKRKGEITKLPIAVKRTLAHEITPGEDDMMTYSRQPKPF